MTFEEMLDQAVAMLQRRGRWTYSALKMQFQLDDEGLEALKDKLLFSHPVVDADGRGLVWTGKTEPKPEPASTVPAQQEVTLQDQSASAGPPSPEPSTPEAELHRLKSVLPLQQSSDNAAEAETRFHHALDIACQQQAKSLELRAATSLARLWQSQGKRQEGHDLLEPVYRWFTEGFDTADLKDAKALLDELEDAR